MKARLSAAFSSIVRVRWVTPISLESLEREQVEVDLPDQAAQPADADDATLERRRLHRRRERAGADIVDDQRGAPAVCGGLGRGGDVLAARVDADIEAAQLLEPCELRGFARRADHKTRAERLGDLDRGDADAGGGAEHQHRLPRLQRAVGRQRVMRREVPRRN